MKVGFNNIKAEMIDSQAKSYINNNKEEAFLEIEKQNSFNDNGSKKIDKFLTLDEINSEKFKEIIEEDEKEKISNHQEKMSKKRKKRSKYLGRKRKYSIFKKNINNINSGLDNDRFSKKKTKKYPKNLRSKNSKCSKNQENFIQIINIFPVSKSKSNTNGIYIEKANNLAEDNNILDNKELNKAWVNWINEVMLKNNSNSENESNKIEEKASQISINIKDLNTFSFANIINNSKNSDKNPNNDTENFVDVLCSKDTDKYLTITNYNSLNVSC